MKVGILTLHSQINYGGVLQAYALRRCLADWGYAAETIDYHLTPQNIHLLGTCLNPRLTLSAKARWALREAINARNPLAEVLRRIRTRRFLATHVHLSRDSCHSVQGLQSAAREGMYEALIVGSDQVWHHRNIAVPNPFLLNWVGADVLASRSIRRIAYAASLGFRDLPDARLPEYQAGLRQFDALSVRETEAAELVQKWIGVRPEVVVDPTLLLRSEAWRGLCFPWNWNKTQTPTVFCYWLGEMELILPHLVCFASRNHVNIAIHTHSPVSRRITIQMLRHPRLRLCASAGPIEFLRNLSQSEGVISDSFHSLMFSVAFRKPVQLFIGSSPGRAQMSARLTDFVGQFGLAACVQTNVGPIPTLPLPDYDSVHERLHSAVLKSECFLRTSLGTAS